MHDPESSSELALLSRRKFGGSILAAAAVTFLSAAPLSADENARGMRPEDLSAADWDEFHARYANLLRVYGERLSSEEKLHAKRILTTNQRMLASIRSFVVENGDPSACTLRVYDPEQASGPLT